MSGALEFLILFIAVWAVGLKLHDRLRARHPYTEDEFLTAWKRWLWGEPK